MEGFSPNVHRDSLFPRTGESRFVLRPNSTGYPLSRVARTERCGYLAYSGFFIGSSTRVFSKEVKVWIRTNQIDKLSTGDKS